LREIERAGGTALASYDSVDSPESAEAIVRTAVDRFGRLDAVVSNAGIFNSHPFEGLPADEWRRMLSVHLDDGFYLSQHAYRVMKPQGYGRFVFISSSAACSVSHWKPTTPLPRPAGLIVLTNVIAIEGAEHGILANTVLPFGFSRSQEQSTIRRPSTRPASSMRSSQSWPYRSSSSSPVGHAS
jgi:NAD(P)-dependent dehydrogenase (short-subunit alcohol dehydrogenase family)